MNISVLRGTSCLLHVIDRAMRGHEVCAHIVTVYRKTGVFQPLTSPAPAMSFMCWRAEQPQQQVPRTNLSLVDVYVDGFSSFSQLPQNCASKSEQTSLPSQREDQNVPHFVAFSLCVCKGGEEDGGTRPKASWLTKGFSCQQQFFMWRCSWVSWGLQRKPGRIALHPWYLGSLKASEGFCWPDLLLNEATVRCKIKLPRAAAESNSGPGADSPRRPWR